MAQQNYIGERNTVVLNYAGFTRVIYENTTVVSFNSERIILNSGGWRTATTKTRMNQTSNEYGLGYQVSQKDFKWFINFKNKTFVFYDRIKLKR